MDSWVNHAHNPWANEKRKEASGLATAKERTRETREPETSGHPLQCKRKNTLILARASDSGMQKRVTRRHQTLPADAGMFNGVLSPV